MKKLVFTALAVVAFSGAAMAKTGDVKEILKERNEILEVLVTNIVIEDERLSECSDVAGIEVEVAESEYYLAKGECFDSWIWNYIYLNALYECEQG
nr:hypothetical protein [Flavobacterium sp.]